MATNLAAVRSYGDLSSAVRVAAAGTTGPVGLAAPAATFKDVGWLGDDGITLSRKVESKTFKAHQGGTVVKTKVTGTENSFKFQCNEENAVVLGLMHAGSTGNTVTGTSTITVPGGIGADPRAWVIDEFEGATINTRYIIPVGTITDRGDVVMKFDDITIYEFTVVITGDFSIVTNSTAVVYPVP